MNWLVLNSGSSKPGRERDLDEGVMGSTDPEILAAECVRPFGSGQTMADSNRASVLLVRSGLTDWDCQGRMQGCADLPLCEKGRVAAATDCAKLGAIHLDVVLSGPDEACRSTASLVAAATGRGKVKTADDLRELALGLWEGQRQEDLEVRFASAYRAWRHEPAKVVPPEGESMADAQDRLIEQVIKGIGRRRGTQGVGIVLRPFAMALVRARIFGLPLEQVWDMLESSPCTEWISLDMAELKQGRTAASVAAPLASAQRRQVSSQR